MAIDVTEYTNRGDGPGDEDLTAMLRAIYAELRRIAGGLMRQEGAAHTLQPTALVHEAILRILEMENVELSDQRRFVGLAAVKMRRVLADHARRRHSSKRSGERVPLDACHQSSKNVEI